MSRSPKIPPAAPEPLALINHIRQCTLSEVRTKLEEVRQYYPDKYVVIADFFKSCKPKTNGTIK